jgi:hypothetical protein
MSRHYGEIAFTGGVQDLQERNGSRPFYTRRTARAASVEGPDPLEPEVAAYLAERDGFYLATVGESGWPYVQFRGGAPGFLKVIDEHTIGWADFRGNLQNISSGNLAGNDRLALLVMDHANRRRLKIFGRGRVVFPEDDAAVIESLRLPDYEAAVEQAVVVAVEAFDWNCAQHIAPRYTLEELHPLLANWRRRIETLEAENAALLTCLGLDA